jgi:hypothetical protein
MKISWKQAKARDALEIHYINQKELPKWTHFESWEFWNVLNFWDESASSKLGPNWASNIS